MESRKELDIVSQQAGEAKPGLFVRFMALCCVVFSALYLMNLTLGLDLIPDVLPLVGNLDEAGATVLLLKGLSLLKRRRLPRTGSPPA